MMFPLIPPLIYGFFHGYVSHNQMVDGVINQLVTRGPHPVGTTNCVCVTDI